MDGVAIEARGAENRSLMALSLSIALTTSTGVGSVLGRLGACGGSLAYGRGDTGWFGLFFSESGVPRERIRLYRVDWPAS